LITLEGHPSFKEYLAADAEVAFFRTPVPSCGSSEIEAYCSPAMV